MANNALRRRKIVIMGSRSVGKTSIVKQLIEHCFTHLYHPTMESRYQRVVKYCGVDYDCEIIDTAGQDEHTLLNPKYVIGVHGYILVYSVTSRNSFNLVQNLYKKILDFGGTESVPCVMVGSKTDLQSSSPSRQIEQKEGEDMALFNNAAWAETSAKDDANIARVFELCIGEIEKASECKFKPSSPAAVTNGRCYIM